MLRFTRFAAALAVLAAAIQLPAHMQAAQNPQGGGAASAGPTDLYIVQMIDYPVSSYTGAVPGFARTKPNRGEKINPNNPNVIGYAGYLDARHTVALGRVGGRKVYDYRYSFNGFAAELTEGQAQALRNVEGVLAVTKNELVTMDTSSTPTFLALDAPGGLWSQLGGVGSAGEDIIIGIVDSGIWPESASFSDRTGTNPKGKGGKLSYRHIPGWHGHCIEGEAFPDDSCGQKLIGARYYNEAWGGDEALEAERPWEFMSPRDYNGHGTHTASTAGGNHGVVATGPASIFGKVSGIAPRARIAAYKALWSTEDGATAGGQTADIVAAIDQAVADGVDVINYSISGSTNNFLDPSSVAFLFAADAGVFVAASAGNAGPTIGTVAHPGPWMTTVAAGTHNRDGRGSVTLGNGVTYNGASLASPVGPAPLIDSEAAGLTGANADMVRLCYSDASTPDHKPVLDPAKVAGKIVVCERGVTARVDKSVAVLEAGGVGMILVNASPNSINADLHFVPTVHIDSGAMGEVRAALKLYAASAGATARINQSALVYDAAAPFTAAFSSRGPLTAGGGDILKPDVIAPGQDIVAAVAPPANHGLSFNVYSGTSMSSPHVAGLAALLSDLHPDWSPMMIKSALMTTGTDVLDGGTPAPNTNPLLIFRQGAGHVVPNSAADPGLVYDSNINDWLAMLCGKTTGVNPAVCAQLVSAGYSLDASDTNVASIAIGDLAGVQTIKRRVTNVGRGTATYNASVTGVSGFNVEVIPSALILGPGETKSFKVTFTRTAAAALNTYVGGQLRWSDGVHTVRSPIVVRPVALAAPPQVSGTGGPINYNVTFGYDGAFTATPRGLIAATTTPGTVADDPDDSFPTANPAAAPDIVAIPVTIAPGTTYARFSLFDANVTPASDIDLYVYRQNANGTQTLVGLSGTGTSQEEVNFVNPTPANYIVYVHGWGVPGTATFTFFHWLLGSADAGNMAVTAPATATTGGSGTIGLMFSGLAPGTKYLGSVAYGNPAELPVNPTIVRVDTAP
jgi:subtilisin family serine protease